MGLVPDYTARMLFKTITMRSKVTKELITEIKTRHNAGESINEIASSLSVAYSTARDIVRDTYRSGNFGQIGEFFDFANRCVITGFSFPEDREKKYFGR